MADLINYLDHVEGDICLRVNRLSRRSYVRNFFAIVSKLGDGGFWFLMAVALLWLQGSVAIPSIVQMAITALLGVLIYKLLKNRLVRERPYVSHYGVHCAAAPLDRYSFPSGHTLHAVSLGTMFSVYEPLLVVIVMPFAILVAASRVILGLHYPSDVVVGAAIGLTLASLSLSLF